MNSNYKIVADKVLADIVRAKVEKSKAIGASANWGFAEQHRYAAKVLIAVHDEDGVMPLNEEELADLLAAITNASATAQKLEKAFAGTGHFIRQKKTAKTAEGFLAEIAAAAMPAKPE